MGIREWTLPGPDALYLDINEVAHFLRTDDKTIRRWIDAGHFPTGQKIGGKLTWTGTDIAAYLHLRGRLSIEGPEGGGQTG